MMLVPVQAGLSRLLVLEHVQGSGQEGAGEMGMEHLTDSGAC
jgi:hypothetical protein